MVNIKRKIIQIANSTQLVSIPRKWAQKYDLKKGDEVDIEEEGNRLIVSTAKSQEVGEVEIDISGLDRDSFMFLIRVLFIKGYDDIKVSFKEPLAEHFRLNKKVKVISEVHREVNRLTGLEVIQQRENFFVLKVLNEVSPKDLDVIIRRVFRLILDASNDLIEGSAKKDKYLVESLEEKHDTITKFIANALRIINKFGCGDSKNAHHYYVVLEYLDNITDALKDTARAIVDANVSISKDCEKMLKRIHNAIEDYHKLYYNYSSDLVKNLSFDRHKIIKDLNEIHKKLSKGEIIIIMRMKRVMEELVFLKNNRMGIEF